MPLDDRDWYRDALREKQGYVERSTFRRPASAKQPLRRVAKASKPSPFRFLGAGWFWAVVGIATGVLLEMKSRGVPLTWHGFRWWLSLWI